MGLEKTQQIGRIVVHPTNPNIVYVAALGAAWKSNPERGLYKTTDGGTTWKLIKFISDKAGFVDVAIDPSNPERPLRGGLGAAAHAVLAQERRPGLGPLEVDRRRRDLDRDQGRRLPRGREGPHRPRDRAEQSEGRLRAGRGGRRRTKDGSYTPGRSTRATASIARPTAARRGRSMNTTDTRPFYYSQVRVDPKNPDRVYFSSTQLQVSNDGGKTARQRRAAGARRRPRPSGSTRTIPSAGSSANDGGIAITFDGAATSSDHEPARSGSSTTSATTSPFRTTSAAARRTTARGAARAGASSGGTPNAYWFTISGGDGFYTAQDPTDPNIVYGESQGGNASRLNLKTGERMSFAQADVAGALPQVGGLDRGRARRSAQAGDEGDGDDARAAPRAAEAGLDRPRDALQLELAVLPLAAQSGGVLLRRQPRAQVGEAR